MAQGSQTYEFKGFVKDVSTNEEIIGASIYVNDASVGDVSKIDGSYSFSATLAPGTYQIRVRALGYTEKRQRLVLGNDRVITNDFFLAEDILNLDEVIVTGVSGSSSRKQLGTAVSTISSKQLVDNGAVAVDQALQGKVAGALVQQNSGDPAGGISVRLRGASTISGSSEPLYIVDGVLINNNSNELVDIGGAAQNRLVDINPADIERIEIIKGAAAAAVYGSRASNGVVQIFTKRGQSGKPKFNFFTSVGLNELRKQIPFNEVPLVWANPFDINDFETQPAERFNLQDDIFTTGLRVENNLSVSGGNEKTKYFASASFLSNEGIVTNTNFDRLATRLNIDQQVNDWLKFSVGLNYSRSESRDMPNGGINAADGAITGFLFANNSINPAPDASGVFPVTSPLVARSNPREAVERFVYGQVTNRTITSLNVTATPFKNFSINYIAGFDYYNQSATGFIPVGNTSTNPFGWSTRGDANVSQFNNDLNLVYELDLNSRWKSTTTVGGTWQQDSFERIGITSDRLAPASTTAVGGTIISTIDARSDISYWGAFVQEGLAFDEKLFIAGALRYDGASVFGRDERSQLFGKASASYVLSNENFWKENLGSTIGNIILRASWGQAGNLTAIGAFDRQSLYNPGALGGISFLTPSTLLGNSNIAPERMEEVELGIDATFFNNRFGFELTYFQQDITDLILRRELASSTGFATRFENVGRMTNEGIELLLRANLLKTKDFSWNATATFTRVRNQVREIVGEQIILPGSFGAVQVRPGEQIGVYVQGFYNRDDDGNIILNDAGLPTRGVNEDGTNVRVIGDPNPDWFGGLVNEFTYKNFTFNVLFDAIQGFDVFNWNRRLLDNGIFGGGVNAGREISGEIPKGTGGAQAAIFEEFVEDGSFVKLREIAIGYSFQPKNGLIENVRINLIGRNLFSFDNYTGWDPEVNTPGQSNAVRGFDFGAVPIPRTYQVGINLTF
ncbi:MAG: SusC/RagA family TonB-linked outer membrane protein [Cyclobacteriaceae bacterium]|nr:SusC/RagA family TonB-linked outer membrane protein [Cyclobacteriaceae bacterium]